MLIIVLILLRYLGKLGAQCSTVLPLHNSQTLSISRPSPDMLTNVQDLHDMLKIGTAKIGRICHWRQKNFVWLLVELLVATGSERTPKILSRCTNIEANYETLQDRVFY
jgi:hypothetical protein